MKLRTVLIASIALFAMSCAKDDFYSGNEDTSKERVITATFETSETKTTLNGLTPLWAVDDEIWISNGTNNETITLESNDIFNGGKSFSFTTTLSGTLYAVYPASCATGTANADGIGITIPTSQDGTFASANICVAKSSDNVLSFRNATAIIKVTGNNSANDYMYFTASEASIAGSFTAKIADDNTVSLTNPTNPKSKIQGFVLPDPDENEHVDSYYAIAPCAATYLTFKARQKVAAGKFATQPYSAYPGSFTFAINKIYTLPMPDWKASDYNESIIIGFSVGSSKIVQFSPGNLWSDGHKFSPTLSFETEQWLTTPLSSGSWNPNHVSHFYWSNDVFKADDEVYEKYTGKDFFAKYGNELQIDGTSGWFTLDKDQWEYLINSRTINGGKGYGKTCKWMTGVHGVNGLVIFPDDYSLGTGDGVTWDQMEAAGCVFLPGAGVRIGSDVGGKFGSNGNYWSSTPNGSDDASNLYFFSTNAHVPNNPRNNGCLVRLVRELN